MESTPIAPMAERDDGALDALVCRLIPAAVIFADHENHVADLRAKAKAILRESSARRTTPGDADAVDSLFEALDIQPTGDVEYDKARRSSATAWLKGNADAGGIGYAVAVERERLSQIMWCHALTLPLDQRGKWIEPIGVVKRGRFLTESEKLNNLAKELDTTPEKLTEAIRTLPSPVADRDAIRDEAFEQAWNAVAASAWRHEGQDAYSQGLDKGAREQVDASLEAISSLKSGASR